MGYVQILCGFWYPCQGVGWGGGCPRSNPQWKEREACTGKGEELVPFLQSTGKCLKGASVYDRHPSPSSFCLYSTPPGTLAKGDFFFSPPEWASVQIQWYHQNIWFNCPSHLHIFHVMGCLYYVTLSPSSNTVSTDWTRGMELNQKGPIRFSSIGIWNSSLVLVGFLNGGERHSGASSDHFPPERNGLQQERRIKPSFQIISQAQPAIRQLGNDGVMVKGITSGSRLPWFRFWLYHLLAESSVKWEQY